MSAEQVARRAALEHKRKYTLSPTDKVKIPGWVIPAMKQWAKKTGVDREKLLDQVARELDEVNQALILCEDRKQQFYEGQRQAWCHIIDIIRNS